MNDYSYHTVSSIINAFQKKCEFSLSGFQADWIGYFDDIRYTCTQVKMVCRVQEWFLSLAGL